MLRKASAVVLMPLLLVAALLAGVALVTGGLWMVVAFNKKQRRDMAVAGAIRTFVRAGEQKNKEKDNGEEQIER